VDWNEDAGNGRWEVIVINRAATPREIAASWTELAIACAKRGDLHGSAWALHVANYWHAAAQVAPVNCRMRGVA
jgi:hypothetical protein